MDINKRHKQKENNFVIIIQEPTEHSDYQLLIALNWLGRLTDFVPLRASAFRIHPNMPTYHDLTSLENATHVKNKWETFLANYLSK